MTASTVPESSPYSLRTAAPGSARVVASHALVICRTSSSHGHPDGVRLAVRCYVHRVDHVADEEQAPAARALVAVELPDEIGCLVLVRVGVHAAALVGDRYDDLVAVLGHLDLDRDLRPAAVAVLDRVHRRLGDRGLQSFQPGVGQSEILHGARYPRQREAFVPRLAGQRERIEAARCYLCHRSSTPSSPWCHPDGDRWTVTTLM